MLQVTVNCYAGVLLNHFASGSGDYYNSTTTVVGVRMIRRSGPARIERQPYCLANDRAILVVRRHRDRAGERDCWGSRDCRVPAQV